MSEKLSILSTVVISRRAADRIRAGHVWVYRSDVVEATGIAPGALVTVEGSGGGRAPHALGSALYSSASEIAIRMISPKPVENLDQLIRERIRAAIQYRERFVRDTNAYRVIFSEGDLLPGVIVDRYNDILSIQVLTQAMDAEPVRSAFLSELKATLDPAAVVERVDQRVRRLEQLPDKPSGLISGTKRNTEIQMNGVRFLFDALAGQKTGAFLDQRENYAAAAQYARGEALDVFCYHGGFALHLVRTCERVTGVDSSRPALEAAEQNAALNGNEIEWMEANAFDLLRDYSDAGNKYDCIVLDPPPFAKSRRDLETALRGYKELNLRALKMLRPDGILVTCCCSYHVGVQNLVEILASAAQDSHRILRILENRGQAKDHPSIPGIPETAYLKCLIAAVS
ncbi:MAG TPA: class I SAM-dependent rRNA methyltransferase [Terriglobales bacterium]|nr:class I SAM-dependent rRNA methyltransferase [Terriglobales bacterium]